MRVLIFHGYLLRGTGSNVYNASLAQALARLGHEVHLLCQDRTSPDLGSGTPGSVTVHNPDIGGLLPVYVADSYEGFEVKTFAELTDDELDSLPGAQRGRGPRLVGELGGVDAALANHLVMGPVILARAGLRFALKVHGSDLSYTVIPDLERFVPYAEEAVAGAAGVLVGSSHTAASLWRAVDDPATNAKARLGPPGVDTELFAPIPPPERPAALDRMARSVAAVGGASPEQSAQTSWDRDTAAAAEALRLVWRLRGAAGGLRRQADRLQGRRPAARRLAAGPSRPPEARACCWSASARWSRRCARSPSGWRQGDLGPLRELAARGWALEGGEEGPLSMLTAFLERLPDGYEDYARRSAGSVGFSGRLEHDEVAMPVPAPTLSSSRAPSRRRSGWSPPRRPPPARCRSPPITPVPPRSAGCSPTRSPGPWAGWSRSDLEPRRRGRDRRRVSRLALAARRRAGAAGEALRETRGAALELGGRRPRGARGLRRPARRPAAPRRRLRRLTLAPMPRPNPVAAMNRIAARCPARPLFTLDRRDARARRS